MKIADYLVQPVRVTYDETVSGTHVVLRLRTDDGIEGVSFVSRLGAGTVQPLALLIASQHDQGPCWRAAPRADSGFASCPESRRGFIQRETSLRDVA